MTDAAGAPDAPTEPPRKGAKTLLLALAVALALGGGTFYAVYAGLVALPFGLDPPPAESPETAADALPDLAPAASQEILAPAYVALEPLVISLGPDAGARHLKVAIALEVAPEAQEPVAVRLPRVRDLLNTFLRAVEPAVLERPRAMPRLRAQMLRRVQLVMPEGAVRDLLIQEFVLN